MNSNLTIPQHSVEVATPANNALNIVDLILGPSFDKVLYFAKIMASGAASIPKHLRGNQSDCAAITMQALRWNMDPYAVATKTHLSPNGSLSYESQLISAVVSASGAFEGDPEYTFIGDWSKVLGKVEERQGKDRNDGTPGGKYYVATYTRKDEEGLGVKVSATLRGESKPRELTVMMSQAYPRFSTQWATDPKLQICYLGLRKFTRLHKPGVLLGIYSPDEMADAPEAPKNMGMAQTVGEESELLKNAKKAASSGLAAYQTFWSGIGKDGRESLKDQHEGLKKVAQEADANRTVDAPPAGGSPKAAAPVSAPAPAQASQAPVDSATVSYAQVLGMLDKAQEIDTLDIASDWIRDVPDAAQRDALEKHYKALRNKMGAA